MAQYFECRINKKNTPSDFFFDDFAHWIMFFGGRINLSISKYSFIDEIKKKIWRGKNIFEKYDMIRNKFLFKFYNI